MFPIPFLSQYSQNIHNCILYSGIRPKLSHPSTIAESVGMPSLSKTTRFDDFLIVEKNIAKSRLLHLFGIESPGLTSSLGIAEHIVRMLCKHEA